MLCLLFGQGDCCIKVVRYGWLLCCLDCVCYLVQKFQLSMFISWLFCLMLKWLQLLRMVCSDQVMEELGKGVDRFSVRWCRLLLLGLLLVKQLLIMKVWFVLQEVLVVVLWVLRYLFLWLQVQVFSVLVKVMLQGSGLVQIRVQQVLFLLFQIMLLSSVCVLKDSVFQVRLVLVFSVLVWLLLVQQQLVMFRVQLRLLLMLLV